MAKVIKRHPIYSDYGATEDGIVISFKGNKELEMNLGKHQRGYTQFRACNRKDSRMYLSHRFIWECWNGIIPPELVIHHLDNDKTNNNLDNLYLCTEEENKKKAKEDGILMGGAAHKTKTRKRK